MAFQVSPGVAVSEIDLTTRVPIPSISDGAIAGNFTWGPLESPTLVSTEDELVSVFGKPNGNTYKTFFTAANFLSYSNKLRIVRAASTSTAKNAVSNGSAILVRNDKEYQNTYQSTTTSGTSFVAKHPGVLGNSLKISVCASDRANTTVSNDGGVSLAGNTDIVLSGQWTASADSTTLAGDSDTLADSELRVGDVIIHGSNTGVVISIASNTSIVVATNSAENVGVGGGTAITSAVSLTRKRRSAFSEPAVNMLGQVSITAESTTVTGTANTNFTRQLLVGDIITVNDGNSNQERRVTEIASANSLTVANSFPRTASNKDFSRKWEFADDFAGPPLTSTYAYNRTDSKDVGDEIHIALVDEDGNINGAKDNRGIKVPKKQVIESFSELSVANGAVGSTGQALYYKDFINDNSNWIRWTDHDAIGDAPLDGGANKLTYDWGATIDEGNTSAKFAGSFSAAKANGIMTSSFVGGVDGFTSTASDEITAYSYFKDPAKIDVSLIMTAEASNTLATYVIDEIAETRKDCVVFISPEEADVVNKEGSEVGNITAKRDALPSSSYAIMDGNYKYMFDRYNSVYRWVPLNGDIAGICAQADNTNPYISPAGFTRGNVKGVIQLAFVPTQAERDDLYLKGVNPIASFPGKGKVLFGDKTMLARPSSFDRINVRRLFIILEKAIANAAENLLFEFNDEFTRLNFVSIIEPFLRTVQSSRGIEDFKVICDGSNNTSAVINRNEFRGDIFIKPTKSINFIGLNFVAVASGVEFSEVVNAV